MKKHLLNTTISVFIIFSLSSCKNSFISDSNINNTKSSVNQADNTIKGVVQFPENKNYTAKATISEIGSFATVAVLNPPDHPTEPNKTIATGLTDSSGVFFINPGISFQEGDIVILDASKRIGSGGKDFISLSTYIKRTGSGWESMTTPDLRLNTFTTALTIITDALPNDILPSDTIGTMSTSSGVTVPSSVNATVTDTLINNVESLVSSAIDKNADPIHYIKYEYGKFVIINPDIIN